MTDAAISPPNSTPSFSELVSAFWRVGLLSFGGPAGQIALMHREIVDERGWVDEDEYLNALNLCHLLPGPEAQQLAAWIGWKLHGWKGGIAAGLLFVIPGAVVMLALSILYAFAAGLGWFAALFLGIKAAVLAIVAQALLRIAGRALGTPFKKIVAAAAFAALFLLDLPFPAVVIGALVLGSVVAKLRPEWLALKTPAPPASARRPWRETLIAIAVWSALWAAPLALVLLTLGPGHVLWKIGAFFSQLAVVTFGGAYAVLAYMAQQAVGQFGWLGAGEMADGLGLAETTPGPLIMVTQFVGFLAAFRAPEPFTPVVAGVLGAGLTTWVTFAPCFLWIFALAPWMDRLAGSAAIKGGLATTTAAVVGVIANLAAWFALHVLFTVVAPTVFGPLRVQVPDWTSFDWRAAALALLAAVLVFKAKWGVPKVLGLCAALGLALALTGA